MFSLGTKDFAVVQEVCLPHPASHESSWGLSHLNHCVQAAVLQTKRPPPLPREHVHEVSEVPGKTAVLLRLGCHITSPMCERGRCQVKRSKGSQQICGFYFS